MYFHFFLLAHNGLVYAVLRAFARNERHTHCYRQLSFLFHFLLFFPIRVFRIESDSIAIELIPVIQEETKAGTNPNC